MDHVLFQPRGIQDAVNLRGRARRAQLMRELRKDAFRRCRVNSPIGSDNSGSVIGPREDAQVDSGGCQQIGTDSPANNPNGEQEKSLSAWLHRTNEKGLRETHPCLVLKSEPATQAKCQKSRKDMGSVQGRVVILISKA